MQKYKRKETWQKKFSMSFLLSDKRGSNPRPAAWEAAALPTELLSQPMKQNFHLITASRKKYCVHAVIFFNFFCSI